MSLLDKEVVKRAKKMLKDFDTKINDIILILAIRISKAKGSQCNNKSNQSLRAYL